MRSSLLLALLAGCASRVSLVDQDLWLEASASEDPFSDRPESISCPSSAWAVEGDPEPSLEVDTGACTYLTLIQPILAPIEAGDLLRVRLEHDDLDAEAPAEAHVAVHLGDATLWEERIPIPSEAASYDVWLPVDAGSPADTDVCFHLHNHGANTWLLSEISAGPDERR